MIWPPVLRTHRSLGPAAWAIWVLSLGPLAWAGGKASPSSIEKYRWGLVTVEVKPGNDERGGRFRILQDGRSVWRESSGRIGYFTLGSVEYRQRQPSVRPRPLLNDQRPSFVVKQWTGGVHCCLVLHVFVTEPRIERVAVIDAQDSTETDFHFSHERWALHTHDWTFKGWKACFADSPAPQIQLVWKKGRFRLDRTRVGRSEGVVERTVRLHREDWTRATPPVALWAEMLDLIYQGRAREALRLFDASWPASRPGKQSFLADFYTQLRTSEYWTEIRAWNSSARWPRARPQREAK